MSLKEQIIENFAVCIKNQCLEEISKAAFEVIDDSQTLPCRIVKENETGQFQIENPNNNWVYFLKIDKCLLFDGDAKKCDFAAFTENEFIFVELKEIGQSYTSKNRRKRKESAYEQLKSTIEIFQEKLSDLSQYSKNQKLYAIASVDGSKAPESDKPFQRMPVATTDSQKKQVEFETYGVVLCIGHIYKFS